VSDVTKRRLALQANGYSPIPVLGKIPYLSEWPKKAGASAEEVAAWDVQFPRMTNTGLLTETTPTCDVDILIGDAADAVEELARDRYDGEGVILCRFGQAPKRALPFQTDRPFSKIIAAFIAPDGSKQKIEFLGAGQQFVVAGIHPDTGQPYRWARDRSPETTPRSELPKIDEAEARTFLGLVGDMLCKEFKFKPDEEETPQGNGHAAPLDTDGTYPEPIDVAAKLVGLTYNGPSDPIFHRTELQCVASLLATGTPLEAAVDMVYDAVVLMVARQRLIWDLTKERNKIHGMAKSFLEKHEELRARFSTASDTWPDPKPLPSELRPVAVLEPEFLPNALAPWVGDVGGRMHCPLDFVAVSVLASLGAVIGRRVGLRPKMRDDWTVVANQWGLFVSPPGALKSPAQAEGVRLIHRLGAEAAKNNATAQADYADKLEKYEMRKKGAEAMLKKTGGAGAINIGNPPTKPTAVRFYTNDCTYESLGVLVQDNPAGILVERDELTTLLTHLDNGDQTTARGFFMTAANGTGSYLFDRIGRGHISAPVCLSILGNTQPARIAEYVRRANRASSDDGLLQRFGLTVWPDPKPDWRNVDDFPNTAARDIAWAVFERVSKLNDAGARAIGAQKVEPYDDIPYLRFTDDAQVLFTEWRTSLEHRLLSEDLAPSLRGHLGKYRKLVPSLALINHMADVGHGNVGLLALQRAIAMAVYLETHAVRLYNSASEGERRPAALILRKIRSHDLTDSFTARDIYRNDWGGLADRPKRGCRSDRLGRRDHGFTHITHTHCVAARRRFAGSARPPFTARENKFFGGGKA
jgi:hypothetical protein